MSRERSPIHWTPQMIAAIGTMPDGELAKEFGIEVFRVGNKRKALGLPSFNELRKKRFVESRDAIIKELPTKSVRRIADQMDFPISWVYKLRDEINVTYDKKSIPDKLLLDAQFVEELATLIDMELAKKYNVHYSHIAIARKKAGVEPPEGSRASRYVEWTQELLDRLGQEQDIKIANELKCSPTTVLAKRQELGIPAYTEKKEWTESELSLLGTMPDKILAPKLSRTEQEVNYRRLRLGIPAFRVSTKPRIQWSDEMISELGTMTDWAFAEKWDMSTSSARLKRTQLNIPSFCEHVAPRDWTEEEEALLGTMSDVELADLIGMSSSGVTSYRNSKGIAPFERITDAIKEQVWSNYMLLTLSELQEITELSPTTISNILAEKGLKMTCGIPADRLEKDKDLVSQLGTMSDDKFSRISGYSRGTIRTVRKRLNIASYRSGLSKDRANE